MSKQSLKTTIDANIKQNGVQAITGQIMNSVLNQMVDGLADQTETSEKLTELEKEIEVSGSSDTHFTRIDGLTLRSAGVQSSTTDALYYLEVDAGSYVVRKDWAGATTATFRYAISSSIPDVGVAVSGYTSKGASEIYTFNVSSHCFLLVVSSAVSLRDVYVSAPKTEGIGLDVFNLKNQHLQTQTEITAIKADILELSSYISESLDFSIEGYAIADGSDSRYPAGSLIAVANNATTPFYSLSNVKQLTFNVNRLDRDASLGVAFYDKDKVFIVGYKGYSGTDATIDSADFPNDAVYVRFSSQKSSLAVPHGVIEPDNNIVGINNRISDLISNIDNDDLTPRPKFWAAIGDSITHTSNRYLEDGDVYAPIDDYSGYDYPNYRGGKTRSYPYFFCKEHRIQWANYGYGGTILGKYEPIGETLLFPFVGDRINQFKEGVDWDYISIFFGWNDRVHGVQYYREKWLKDTYGTAIKYTTDPSKYGTSGYCTEDQKNACDNASATIGGVSYTGEKLFYMQFLGTIDDDTLYTYCGAYNYALTTLMMRYRNAKVMLIVPFLGGSDRFFYEKMRQVVIDLADKYGLTRFDFYDLPYWYFSRMVSTPFRNPDRADGRWLQENGSTLDPATIEGFYRSLYCYDSVHPTDLGNRKIADPIGNKLVNG